MMAKCPSKYEAGKAAVPGTLAMPSLGNFLLLASFVVCAYAIATSVAGARRRSRRLVESGIGAFHLITALMTVASAVMVHAFVTNNYSIKYVQRYSDTAQPLAYKIASYWGGLDGSIMFWVFLLGIFGTIAVHTNRERHRELIPYVVAVIATVEMFFLFLMVVHNNPFSTYLAQAPADGKGLNPLLQNFYMAIHPPSLYVGFVSMTIPYAFGMAALITGHLDDSWLRAVRRWTMVGWLLLSFGLTLGMLWAYEELGWGGFWGWDPVENAAALPWFTATAFLHSVMVQERRGMLRVWNVTLVIVTFFLTIFGTFMTRSGVVQSVHAFGEDRALATAVHHLHGGDPDLQFCAGDLPPAAAAGASRSGFVGLARGGVPRQQLDPAVLGVLRPVRDDVPDAERSRDARAADGRAGLLQQVDAADRAHPAAADRHRPAARLAQVDPVEPGAAVPLAGDCGGGDGGGALRGRHPRLELGGVLRALRVRRRDDRPGVHPRRAASARTRPAPISLTSMIGLVSRSRRRYGGYIVHVGIVLIFLGFAGQGFKKEEQVLLKVGQQATVGGVHRAPRRAAGDERCAEADGHRARDGDARRQGARRHGTGALVLQQARRGADDRGGDPARAR